MRPWLARSDEEKSLFLSVRGGRLAVRTIAQIVDRAAKTSGVAKPITPHTFRHSMATQMLRNHADLRHIQAFLGHTSITSTELYTHVSFEDLKEAMRRAHSFLAAKALNEAKKIVSKSESVVLSNRDRDLFYSLLKNPPKPNKSLVRLMKDHRK